MDSVLICLLLFKLINLSRGDTYSVRVGTEQHVNLVDTKFLSFTIDPKYLFTSSEKYRTKECICMASSLSPAYIRIAGPSTASMVFKNTTISINDDDDEEAEIDFNSFRDDLSTQRKDSISVSHKQWEKFVRWAKSTGFDLVFALNNDEETANGMWDPNTALRVLTVADQANVGNIYWQLGYECTNKSIEEYLNDLETLRVIIETFPPGKSGRWLVVGGDITHCLQADSKSDFKDYVTLSNDMMDAILLNGNSSSRELERMSEKDRLQLLKLLSQSTTPLWLTENNHIQDELGRAADWMTSLGYSARNGFAVHYRELMERELYEPTLSFYMALLFKNLVGERVLSVDIDAPQAMIFAHCTTLRHKPVPGAITLYGVNMEDEPARFSIKLSQTEEGGDIMQFILGHDHNGNIVVNGRAMYYEGDIKPVVRRISPYKTLLINLPSKSFGFWVLANTKVEACQNVDDKIVEKNTVEKSHEIKDRVVALVKRSILTNSTVTSFKSPAEDHTKYQDVEENQKLKVRIDNINNDLKVVQEMTRNKPKFRRDIHRIRRDIFDRKSNYYHDKKSIFEDLLAKIHIPVDYGGNLMEKISKFKETNLERLRQTKDQLGSLLVKRSSRKYKRRPKIDSNELRLRSNKLKSYKSKNRLRKSKTNDKLIEQISKEKVSSVDDSSTNNQRNRRSINTKQKYITGNDVHLLEDEIKKESNELLRINKILHKVKKKGDLPVDMATRTKDYDYYEDLSDGITLNTKISDDSAMVSIHDETNSGILKNTLHDVMGLLGDLNKQLNRFWSTITILE